jgi:hypothetical protein
LKIATIEKIHYIKKKGTNTFTWEIIAAAIKSSGKNPSKNN